MERYEVGLYVSGIMEVHELANEEEELQEIINSIYTVLDLLHPIITIEVLEPSYVVKSEN